MITIRLEKEITQEIEAFQKKEWLPADIEHFGKIVDWEKKIKILTATDQEELVGLLELEMKSGVMHISSVLVKHGRHGEGIGTELMKEAERIANEHRIHKLYLETGKKWTATKFYEKLGFRILAELPNFWAHHHFVIYTKDIDTEKLPLK